jgi:hypothetical protein
MIVSASLALCTYLRWLAVGGDEAWRWLLVMRVEVVSGGEGGGGGGGEDNNQL